MRIYRCLSEQEDINQIILSKKNTHVYQKNISYIHFFRYSQSAEFFYQNYLSLNTTNIMYMVANIPNSILKKYTGYAIYKNNVIIPQYALPEKVVQEKYVVTVSPYIDDYFSSDKKEYSKYEKALQSLAELFCNDYDVIIQFLSQYDLTDLLDVDDDDRTEEQIYADTKIIKKEKIIEN